MEVYSLAEILISRVNHRLRACHGVSDERRWVERSRPDHDDPCLATGRGRFL